jgi:uncharacterized membrane protein YraQ (UPF0718 family)
VTTPATSIIAFLVAYGLLGLKFTTFIFFAAIAMGLVMGLVGNRVGGKAKVLVPPAQQARDSVCEMNVEVGKRLRQNIGGRFITFAVPTASKLLKMVPKNI